MPLPSQEMSLNININRSLPVKVSGSSPKLLSRSVTLPQSCNVVNPGKMFHSNSVGSPMIPSVSVAFLIDDPFNPFLPSFVGFRMLMDLSKAQHRIWEDVDFCALKIDYGFITNQWQLVPWISSPMNLTHIEDLILFAHQSCRYVEHSLQCEICGIHDGIFIIHEIFPMNVAAFIVAAMNIPQIIDCSSPDPATFDIFCLFRTSSFTLITNSAASLPMTKITESASSW